MLLRRECFLLRNYFLYCVCDIITAKLIEAIIGWAIYYTVPLHLVYKNLGRGAGAFPVAEQVAKVLLSAA